MNYIYYGISGSSLLIEFGRLYDTPLINNYIIIIEVTSEDKAK